MSAAKFQIKLNAICIDYINDSFAYLQWMQWRNCDIKFLAAVSSF